MACVIEMKKIPTRWICRELSPRPPVFSSAKRTRFPPALKSLSHGMKREEREEGGYPLGGPGFAAYPVSLPGTSFFRPLFFFFA